MSKLAFAAFAAALLVAPTASFSTTVPDSTFLFFGGSGGKKDSYTFSDDGISVDVTAGTIKYGEIKTGAKVGQYDWGLGVSSHSGDWHYLDGSTKDEIMIFDFDQTVQIDKIIFSYADHDDDFELFIGGDSGLESCCGSIELRVWSSLSEVSGFQTTKNIHGGRLQNLENCFRFSKWKQGSYY